jgi:L-cystine transport system permease protein
MILQKELDWAFLWESLLKISAKIPTTMYLALIATFFGVVLGLFIALVKVYKVPVLRRIAAF